MGKTGKKLIKDFKPTIYDILFCQNLPRFTTEVKVLPVNY